MLPQATSWLLLRDGHCAFWFKPVILPLRTLKQHESMSSSLVRSILKVQDKLDCAVIAFAKNKEQMDRMERVQTFGTVTQN